MGLLLRVERAVIRNRGYRITSILAAIEKALEQSSDHRRHSKGKGTRSNSSDQQCCQLSGVFLLVSTMPPHRCADRWRSIVYTATDHDVGSRLQCFANAGTTEVALRSHRLETEVFKLVTEADVLEVLAFCQELVDSGHDNVAIDQDRLELKIRTMLVCVLEIL